MKRDSRRESRRLSLIQGSMIDAVKGCFTESELNALRVVIRLTVEFGKNLEADRLDNYVAESVFSGMDSFTSLVHAYGVLAGAEMDSLLQWKKVSISSLKRDFKLLYPKCLRAKSFERQCRLLLDLFKLQIALAAMTYDCGAE